MVCIREKITRDSDFLLKNQFFFAKMSYYLLVRHLSINMGQEMSQFKITKFQSTPTIYNISFYNFFYI